MSDRADESHPGPLLGPRAVAILALAAAVPITGRRTSALSLSAQRGHACFLRRAVVLAVGREGETRRDLLGESTVVGKSSIAIGRDRDGKRPRLQARRSTTRTTTSTKNEPGVLLSTNEESVRHPAHGRSGIDAELGGKYPVRQYICHARSRGTGPMASKLRRYAPVRGLAPRSTHGHTRTDVRAPRWSQRPVASCSTSSSPRPVLMSGTVFTRSGVGSLDDPAARRESTCFRST